MSDKDQDPPLLNEPSSSEDVLATLEKDLARIDDEANAILESIREDETPRKRFNSPARDIREDDGDEDDDDGIGDEILRLGSVVATIQQDLDATSVDSATSGLSMPVTTDSSSQLHPLKTEQLRVDGLAGFLRAHGIGAGGNEMTLRLLIFNLLIWSLLYLLFVYVRYGTIANDGRIHMWLG